MRIYASNSHSQMMTPTNYNLKPRQTPNTHTHHPPPTNHEHISTFQLLITPPITRGTWPSFVPKTNKQSIVDMRSGPYLNTCLEFAHGFAVVFKGEASLIHIGVISISRLYYLIFHSLQGVKHNNTQLP